MNTQSRHRDVPIYLCCYHKVGTVLLINVFRQICAVFGWRFKHMVGKCEHIPDDADVYIFYHSMVDLESRETPYTGAHFIRDPRDIIVSGYLYHKRCDEKWCINTDFDLSEPLCFPKIPRSQEYRSEPWKRRYISGLNLKSYQQNLLDRDKSDGILFELERYAGWTIHSMTQWNFNNSSIKEIRYETLMSEYDQTFKQMFEHFGFNNEQIRLGLEVAASQDINRMSDEILNENNHITSRQFSRWQEHFEDIHKATFKQKFIEIVMQLGYETTDSW